MNCASFEREMTLYFGQEELPEAMARHLRECHNCRAAWEELRGFAEGFPPDSLFYPDERDAKELAAKVEQRIDLAEDREKTAICWWEKLTSFKDWAQVVPAAAAVVLVIGVSLIAYFSGITEVNRDMPTQVQYEGLTETASGGYYEELDNGAFNALLQEFTANRSVDAGESLLNDISEEELEYLEKNLNVRDLL